MRVMIVDDEELARGIVREFLGAHADVEIVAECANGFDAVKAITELEPDLVLLDIQMPRLNGFEVVELAGRKSRYIFVTAFDQYALKAFDIHAVDYLLKPFSQQRFDEALAHARGAPAPAPAHANAQAHAQAQAQAQANANAQAHALEALVATAAQRGRPLERVLIRDGAKVHVVPVDSIDVIEAQDDYVRIGAGGKSYLKNQRLAELEALLDAANFVRLHRSYIVNIAAVARIEQVSKDSHCAVLRDGSRVPISRSGYQKVRSLMD